MRAAKMCPTRGHVLIIEDEMLVVLEIEARLRDIGFDSFETADTPILALERATARRPDLITADFHILGGTGPEAIGAITAQVGAVAVVHITASPELLPPDSPWPRIAKPLSTHAMARACEQAEAAVATVCACACSRSSAPGRLDELHDGHHAVKVHDV